MDQDFQGQLKNIYDTGLCGIIDEGNEILHLNSLKLSKSYNFAFKLIVGENEND